jgi:hypothetical protein
MGHRCWAESIGKDLSLDTKKVPDILRGLIDEVPKKEDRNTIWQVFWEVVTGVSTAKIVGYVPEGKFPNARRLVTMETFHSLLDEQPDEFVIDLIDEILKRSIKAAYQGNVDHNDQVYMPALFGGIFPRFPLVTADETQDFNPVNYALLDKLVKHRFIGVGDPWQSIYAFRGAVQGGMEALADRFSTTPLNLSISFRCPSEIVKLARWRVPHFKWIKEGGHVSILNDLNASDIPDGAAILCRNNAPLFAAAVRLLNVGRGVSVAGSEIGPKLIAIMRKLGPESLSQNEVEYAIQTWREEKLAKGSKIAKDIADCMNVFAEHGANLGQAVAYAEHLFKQSGSIRCLTGHKAKGLEFPIVYHLDPWLLDEYDEQDKNLRYVIQTRSMDRYYEIDSTRIAWKH